MNRKQFLQQVTSFVGPRDAKKHVEKELDQHLQYAKEAWLQKGYSEEEAEQHAVQAMGSATTLGQSLGKLHKPKVDWIMIGLVGLLLALSFLPILAINGTDYPMYDGHRFVLRNTLFIVAATFLMLLFLVIDIQRFAHLGTVFYGAGLLLLVLLVRTPDTIMNGEAMLLVGSLRVSAWYVLPFFCLAWAALFSSASTKLWHAFVLMGIPAYFIALIPNLSVLFLFCVMTLVLFLQGKFTRRAKRSVLVIAIVTPILGLVYLVVAQAKGILASYQISRLQGYWNPEAYADTSGYLNVLLKEVLANAQWFGSSATRTIPEAHTDFVFASLMQSYGISVALFIVLLLFAVLGRMCWQSIGKPQSFAKLVVSGASTLYATQVLYAIAMTYGLVPLVSMPLPFMSYGITPLLLNACMVGIVLSVYRRRSYIYVK